MSSSLSIPYPPVIPLCVPFLRRAILLVVPLEMLDQELFAWWRHAHMRCISWGRSGFIIYPYGIGSTPLPTVTATPRSPS